LSGRISGIAKFGIFVKLDETGADALVPIRTLGTEYFDHDQDSQTLMGSKSGIVIGLGQRVVVKLAEAGPITGGLTAELITLDGTAMPSGPSRGHSRGGRGKPPHRKAGSAKKKAAKTARKVKRTRS
jgi:ribonuclease R